MGLPPVERRAAEILPAYYLHGTRCMTFKAAKASRHLTALGDCLNRSSRRPR